MMPPNRISKNSLILFKIIHSNLAHAGIDNFYIQAQKMILKVGNDKPNIMETQNSKELLRQLELFEFYRPDSPSDASRNLFGSNILI